MKVTQILMTITMALLMVSPVIAGESRVEKQARLDKACEVAREEKLIPMRKEFVEECVATRERSTREDCERFYSDYGNRMGGRAPLFFDLPQCVEAFDFQQSARRSG